MELERLKKWEHQLNACIRCGYCYEFCPVYRSTRWETDSPRGKLILISGLLHGEIEATSETTDKIFSCFYCKQCEGVCSSGIPFTEILSDTRADLLDLGVVPTGTISYNESPHCAMCLGCVRACPHEARVLEGNRVVIDPTACQSCGICLDVCPGINTRLGKGFDAGPEMLQKQAAEFLSAPENPAAKAIVFACNWSNVPGLETARLDATVQQPDPEYKVLVTACAGRLPAKVMLDALEHNAWGVLVNGCPEDECEHHGSHEAAKRVAAVQRLLGEVGATPRRVQYMELSKGDPLAFERKVTEFMDEIRKLGPPFQRGDQP